MKYLIYAAACWPLVSVIVGALLARAIHLSKIPRQSVHQFGVESMSEVHRYWVPNEILADQSGWHQDDNEVVLASGHDRELTALREELARKNEALEREEIRTIEFCERLTELQEDFNIVSEERDNAGRNASDFEDRMGNLQVENGKLQQSLEAAEQRTAELVQLLHGWLDLFPYRGTFQDGPLAKMKGHTRAALKPPESGAGE